MNKICFIVDSIFTFGGVQRVTAVIAKELAKEHDVTIVTFDDPSLEDKSIYGLCESNINYSFFKYPNPRKITSIIYKTYSAIYKKYRLQSQWCSNIYAHSSFPEVQRIALTKEIKKGKYDCVIGVHAPLATRIATLRPHLQGVKLIGWIHNSFEALFDKGSNYIGPERKRHYVYQFRKLDSTVLLCHHDAESYYNYDQALKPTVIYNPLTLRPGKLSLGNSKRFLAIGRFSHQHKGYDLLIEAFNIFARTNSEWKLDIVGEGPEEKMYRELIAKYNLKDRIIIHPFTNNIQKYYSNAQVYVLSSRWEGFGLVIVEAMAHGLPVISSDLPTSKEIMGDFGIYFKNGDIKDLASKLEEATKINWQQKSDEAITISKRFNVGSIIEQWKDLIEK